MHPILNQTAAVQDLYPFIVSLLSMAVKLEWSVDNSTLIPDDVKFGVL